jgi:hypothetical protein
VLFVWCGSWPAVCAGSDSCGSTSRQSGWRHGHGCRPNRPAMVATTRPAARTLRGQDRRQLDAGGGASVLLQRSCLSVPGRPPARSPQQPAGNQRDNQDDEQGPAEGSQPLGLGGRGRCACSRGRGGRGWCQGLSRGRGRGRGRVRTLGRGGGPGRSRRFCGRLARRLGPARIGPGAGAFGGRPGRRVASAAGTATAERQDQAQHEPGQEPCRGCSAPRGAGFTSPVPGRGHHPPRQHPRRPHRRPPPDRPGQSGGSTPGIRRRPFFGPGSARHHPKRVRTASTVQAIPRTARTWSSIRRSPALTRSAPKSFLDVMVTSVGARGQASTRTSPVGPAGPPAVRPGHDGGTSSTAPFTWFPSAIGPQRSMVQPSPTGEEHR